MFRCEKCGRNGKPKEKYNIVPTKTRKKFYGNGSIGTEIVKESKLCKHCAEKVIL